MHTRIAAVAGLALAALAAAPLTQRPAQQAAPAQPDAGMPAVQLAGPRSAIASREFHLVTDQPSLDRLWERHEGEGLRRNLRGWPVTPTVDFERRMVVAYFRGPSRVNDGEFVVETLTRGDALVVRFDALRFQTATFGDEPEPDDSCTPYGLWVLDRHEGPVVLEEDQRSLINAPPRWVEVHRFEARG